MKYFKKNLMLIGIGLITTNICFADENIAANTAPTGSLTSTVVKHPTKIGFYNVNLKLTAKDNYDPLPEIVFTSVTAGAVSNSPFNAGAYTLNTPNNTITGAYPSTITFAADASVAKQYKINYTVTDASDNKTVLSTIITVPKR